MADTDGMTSGQATTHRPTPGHARQALRAVGAGFNHLPPARRFLAVLLLLFAVKQLLTVVLFPPFSGHDEVAHYAYIRTLATEHRIPTIPDLEEFRVAIETSLEASRKLPPVESLTGDYLPNDLYPYCHYALDWDWCDEPRWAADPPHVITWNGQYYPWGWQYAANHPPLYHALMIPIYRASAGATPATQQYLLRAAAIPLGLAVVLLAYLLATTLFPGDRFLAITVPAFVAFQPQVSYEAAMVNNDILAIALVSLLLYLTVRGLRDRFPWRTTLLLGAALGLGLLAKSTVAMVLPGLALALVLGVGLRQVRRWLARGAAIGGTAGLLAAPWYVFLWRTYGNFSGLDQIAALQWHWVYPAGQGPSLRDELLSAEFARMRWRETWGEFGWRLIHLDDRLLLAIGLPCLVALLGLGRYAVVVATGARHRKGRGAGVFTPVGWQIVALLVLLLTAVVAYGAVLQFGLRFQLTQARYYFPAVNAVALLLMLGLRALLPTRALPYGQGAIVGGLVLLNLLIYTQYVIPFWYLPS